MRHRHAGSCALRAYVWLPCRPSRRPLASDPLVRAERWLSRHSSFDLPATVTSVRSLKLRALAFVLALVQVVTPGLAALADAELQAASNSPAAAAHVESHGRPQCPRVHTDDCILCQYLTTNRCRPG